MTPWRGSLALIGAPSIIPVYFVLLSWLESEGWPGNKQWAPVIFVSLLISYAAFIFMLLPLIYLLSAKGRLNLGLLMVFGGFDGLIAFFAFVTYFLESRLAFSNLQMYWGFSLGALVALFYGVIAGVRWRSI